MLRMEKKKLGGQLLRTSCTILIGLATLQGFDKESPCAILSMHSMYGKLVFDWDQNVNAMQANYLSESHCRRSTV